MDLANVLFIVWGMIALKLFAELGLAALNRREVKRHAEVAPPAVAAMVDAPTYRNSVAYTLAKNRFGMVSHVFEAGVLALLPRIPEVESLSPASPAHGGEGATWVRLRRCGDGHGGTEDTEKANSPGTP